MSGKISYFPPSDKIKYGYHLFVPDGVTKGRLFLWCHGSIDGDYPYDDGRDFALLKTFSGLFSRANSIVVVPVIPRDTSIQTYPLNKRDSQIMAREVMSRDYGIEEFYLRPDLEVLKILDEVRSKVTHDGIILKEKVTVGGISAGATFTNRFSLLYPHLVDKAILLMPGIFMYPTSQINNVPLSFPFGTFGLESFTGKEFDLESFRKIPHYIYQGELDNDSKSDIGRYEMIGVSDKELIEQVVGNDKVSRTKLYVEYLRSLGMDIKLNLRSDLAHQTDNQVISEAFALIGRE